MFFQRFYDTGLAQASYMIGCQKTGEALVVDPNRDVQQYLDAAAKERLRITHVTETHIHADFVSGARELARRAGAHLLLSAEGGDDWQYAFAAEDGARLLHDGDHFPIGNIRVEVMHTPGHTPEHLSFVVTDQPASAAPWGILTGDFVFVGDVGRPDLLEKAAGVAGTMEAGARTLFHSLARFRALPDFVQVWPGHGAGSACGKALGAVPSSTVGYEKGANWALGIAGEDEFVRAVLDGQPDPPRYFAEMKRINRAGPPLLGGPRVPTRRGLPALTALLQQGATVVDTRPAADFANGHVPGTVSIPLGASFVTWAGWLLPYDRDLFLITEDGDDVAKAAVRDLAMIGLDRVSGTFGPCVVEGWANAETLETVPQATPHDVSVMLQSGTARVVDVRSAEEWAQGHLPGTPNIPLGHLTERLRELPTDKPIVVQCQAGSRSAIAAGLLQARGVHRVVNLAGGYVAWQQAGLPVERGAAAAMPSPSAHSLPTPDTAAAARA